MPDHPTARSEKQSLAQQRRQNWEKRWSDETCAAFWLDDKLPNEIQMFIDEGWFDPSKSVLDIGCGRGEVAYGLASIGMKTTGIDFSKSAIKRAKELYCKPGLDLEFFCRDICRKGGLDIGPFDYLVDRGCLHVIPDQRHSVFVKNIAALIHENGKFLLLHKNPKQQDNVTESKISATLEPWFSLENIRSFEFGHGPEKLPGLAMEFRRTHHT